MSDIGFDFALDPEDRKISEFPTAEVPLDSSTLVTFVADDTNFTMTLANFLAALNVSGTLSTIGDGTPVLDVDGTTNFIRSITGGVGIDVAVDPDENIEISSFSITEEVSDYQITGSREIVICGGSVPFTVFLNPAPVLGDISLLVRTGTADITADPDAETINGVAGTQTLSTIYDVLELIYTTAGWVQLS